MPIYASPLNVEKNQPPSWLWPLGRGEKTETNVLARETNAAKLH